MASWLCPVQTQLPFTLLNSSVAERSSTRLLQPQTTQRLYHASGLQWAGMGGNTGGRTTALDRLKPAHGEFNLCVRDLSCRRWRLLKKAKKSGNFKVQASIGFTADPRVSVERAAADLLRDAASLLIYQEVLKRPAAQAFLKVLLALRRSDDGVRILEAYGEFFRLMAQGGHASWEDYVLDGILTGESNPFADSAAGLEPGQPPADVPDSLSAAAAYDLDTLQRLSIGETTLSGWVSELVGDIQPHWRKAASQTLGGQSGGRRPETGSTVMDESTPSSFSGLHDLADNSPTREQEKPQTQSGGQLGFDLGDMAGPDWVPAASPSGGGMDGIGFFAEPASRDSVNADLFPLSNHGGSGGGSLAQRETSSGAAEAPSEESRDRWRSKIGGMWRWSEAVPLLQEYYLRNGTGAVASSTDLAYKSGKLIPAASGGKPALVAAYGSGYDLTVQRDSRSQLLDNLERHCDGGSAHHVLLEGESGSGKSWIVRSVAAELGRRRGLRTVALSKADLKTLPALGAELARFPNLRFLILLDDLTLKQGEEAASILASALEDNSVTWPSNAIFCVTSRSQFLYADGLLDPSSARHVFMFGLVLSFPELTSHQYVLCLQEISAQAKRSDPASSAWRPVVDAWKSVVSEGGVGFAQEPLEWARRFGALSVRLAVRFMRN